MKTSTRDPLKSALMKRTAAEILARPFVTAPPTMPVRQAIDLMGEKGIGCLLVVEGDALVGMFSERDVLDKVAEDYPASGERTVGEVMTSNPTVVYDTDPAAAALCVMAACGYRHVPVLDLNEKITGVVSPLRMLTFIQEHLQEP